MDLSKRKEAFCEKKYIWKLLNDLNTQEMIGCTKFSLEFIDLNINEFVFTDIKLLMNTGKNSKI